MFSEASFSSLFKKGWYWAFLKILHWEVQKDVFLQVETLRTVLSSSYITFKAAPCYWKGSTLSIVAFNFLLETYSFYIFPFLLIHQHNTIFWTLNSCHYWRAAFWVAAWKRTKRSCSSYGVCDHLLQATVIFSVHKFSFCIKPWGNTPPVSTEMTNVTHLFSLTVSGII